MDDIQKRADDKAWDEKQNRWISDANRRLRMDLVANRLRRYMVCTYPRMTSRHTTSMR